MMLSIAKICNPRRHSVEDAIRCARVAVRESPSFEFHLARFVQAQCLANHPNLPAVFQALEMLGGILDEKRLRLLLKPFLRSTDSRIVSKCVLILGRRSSSVAWLMEIMNEPDDRLRANLVESLWRRREPELEEMLMSASNDRHHRVAANAVRGLYLLGSGSYEKGLNRLISSADSNFRRAAVWVLREGDGIGCPARFKPFILDPHPDVRGAAFKALVSMRKKGPG